MSFSNARNFNTGYNNEQLVISPLHITKLRTAQSIKFRNLIELASWCY